VPGQGQFAKDLVDAMGAFGGARVLGEPQLGGVRKAAAGRELGLMLTLTWIGC